MDKGCIWRSPSGVGTGFISEISEGFEKKYGVNVFSDDTERSQYAPINPSDLEFSPQLQCLFQETTTKPSSSLSHKSSEALTIASVVSSSPRHSVSASSGTTAQSPQEKNNDSYLNYGGSTFGLKPSPRSQNQPSQPIGTLNPWILSDGIPNFAKNQKCAVLKELTSKSSAQTLNKRTSDDASNTIDAALENASKKQRVCTDNDTVDGEELLSAIREELKQYESMDKRLVDAISSIVESAR